MKIILSLCAVLAIAVTFATKQPQAPASYVPKAQFCANRSGGLCPTIPAYIGPNPRLKSGLGYSGLFGPLPTSALADVETPFDNMAWQMFVGLNWAANAVSQPPAKGLSAPGPRVWQTYRRVSAVFGNSLVRATCANPSALPVYSIGSNGKGKPAPNNEEYFQASTNLPLIDVNGNWTIYERRMNDVEARYLMAPNGNASQTLTTLAGQANFVKNNPRGVQFTASSTVPAGANGSMEIKTSWRILNTNAGDDSSRYYTERALVAVAGDLVSGGQQLCAPVLLGLVGMHIIQRNPTDTLNGNLLNQWIWATFEHVDNAPPGQTPCSVSTGCSSNGNWINKPSCGPAAPSAAVRYSFYNRDSAARGTNIVPVSTSGGAFRWNSKAPYATGAVTASTLLPQVTRCWSVYPLTAQLNTQWQGALAAANTPFQNYMLVGTQWGSKVEPREGLLLPTNAVPALLSNTTLETYIQNYTGSLKNGPGPGSCVGCHSFATLSVGKPQPSADLSFLPGLVQPATARSKIRGVR